MLVSLILIVVAYVLWRMGLTLVMEHNKLGAAIIVVTVLLMFGVGYLAYDTVKRSKDLSDVLETPATRNPSPVDVPGVYPLRPHLMEP